MFSDEQAFDMAMSNLHFLQRMEAADDECMKNIRITGSHFDLWALQANLASYTNVFVIIFIKSFVGI